MESERSSTVFTAVHHLCSNTDKLHGYRHFKMPHALLGQFRATAGRVAIAAVQTDTEDGNRNACPNVGIYYSLGDSTPQAHPASCLL